MLFYWFRKHLGREDRSVSSTQTLMVVVLQMVLKIRSTYNQPLDVNFWDPALGHEGCAKFRCPLAAVCQLMGLIICHSFEVLLCFHVPLVSFHFMSVVSFLFL